MLVNVRVATECWSMNGWQLNVGQCLGDNWMLVNVWEATECWSMSGWQLDVGQCLGGN